MSFPAPAVYREPVSYTHLDVVCIVKGSKHKKEAEEYVDFVTGKAAQTVIADSLDRRSVRKDVEAAAYLPDKEEIHMITADAVSYTHLDRENGSGYYHQ